MSSTLVCDCAIHTIVFFGEFWLTSAASRQNSSEQYGRSTYCAARQAPPRSGGYSEAVYKGVWQIAHLHFYPFLTVREICLHHTPRCLLGRCALELADNSQALIHIALFCALLRCARLRCNQRKHRGHGKHPLTVLTAKGRIRPINVAAIRVLIFIQSDPLVEEIREPVIFLLILLRRTADALGNVQLIVIADIFAGAVNDPAQDRAAQVRTR